MATSMDSDQPIQEPTKSVSRGAFIVVEGLDRAGKTTQVKKLCDVLSSSGRKLKSIRFPDRKTPIGKMIDSYLQSKTKMDDKVIHLLFSANRWEHATTIAEAVAQGCTVVCDRYYYSGMVYSAAKQNSSLSLAWARSPDVGLPKPDVVIFLDLDPKEAEMRGGYGEEKYEQAEMQQRVRQLFLGLKQREDGDERHDLKIISAGGTIEEVGKLVLETALEAVQAVESCGKDLGTVKAWK